MNINQLRYFLTIVKYQSFSNAAYELFISQSSISKQIKALEEELGIILFNREHSKIRLTEAGEVFLPYAEKTLKEYQALLNSIEEYQTIKQSTVRMGSVPIVSAYGVANKIAHFTSIHREKNLCFDMHESTQSQIIKELQANIVDIALLRLDCLHDIEQYDILPYVVDEIVMVCHKNHFLATKSHISLEEISHYPLILLDAHSVLHKLILHEFEKHQLNCNVQCLTTRHKILMEMLSANSTISLLPQRLVEEAIFPDIRTVKLTEPVKSSVALVKLKEPKLNQITKAFWNYWKTECTGD